MSYKFFFRKTFSNSHQSFPLAPFFSSFFSIQGCCFVLLCDIFQLSPIFPSCSSSSFFFIQSYCGGVMAFEMDRNQDQNAIVEVVASVLAFGALWTKKLKTRKEIASHPRVVLRASLKLYKLVIRLPNESTPSEIRKNPRFYPYFKYCIGVLDGTHVRASVPLNIQGRFRSRKVGTMQNVLAAITFDLKFSYVLAGWECNAHDSHILSDALSRPRGLRIPKGKYYLADAGYGIQNGYITPYRGVRYHLKEFSDQGPENAKELFNLRHSSLRITIEHVFGILKKRFRVLDAEPFWNFRTQDDNMKMITCDRATYDAAIMAHKKYEPFLNKSIDHYDEMTLVVGKDKATESFARTFADIDLDDGNQDSVPIDGNNKEIEEVRTNVSSSGTSKCKRKNVQESVVDEQIKFVGEQLGKIANILEQFTADKTPHLYYKVMSMEEEGFDDDFPCSVFDYLLSHESEAKAFLVKSKKHRKIWLQKFLKV
ncbi:hypothetical protein CXB51_003119 [Gossypium anomalum]|uniref:DDE Tnp4 domain-containing protein n=1 Tax=Gossypium anomalum TaxID=47600 RepID=A0A8J6D9X2_9ROSI|nr:hypothetical protein CXB51_003119 [Gossypium anomalum]